MTDVGIRASAPAFDYPRAGAARRRERRLQTGPGHLLRWELALTAALAVTLSVVYPVATGAELLLLVGCWGACLVLTRATEVSPVGSRVQASGRVLRAGCGLALVGSAWSIVPGASLTTVDAFAIAVTCVALSCTVRAVRRISATDTGCVLVVGDAPERQHAVAALERRTGPGLEVVAMCLDPDTGSVPPGESSVRLEDLPDFARQIRARSVVMVPGPRLDPAGLRRVLWRLEGARLPCFVGTGLVGVAPGRLATSDVEGLPLVRVHEAKRSGLAWHLVEWTGRALAALALVVTLPLLIGLIIAIRRGSPGPAIFRQTRVGQHGRLFTMYKLRTMRHDVVGDVHLDNECDGVLFKMRQDPRITSLGGCLRKYSLDELPQLANVVLGQMRLIGPRPALPDEVAAYPEDARRRLAVRPGITGLWQVSGRSDLTWDETVRLDLHYVDNWSPWLDLLILCRTLGAVLGHRGAY